MTTKYYTIEEVKKHNKISDLWTIYKGEVYNITNFVNNHPGGNIIKKAGGKDLEIVWEEYGFEWHNNNGIVINNLKKYKIGKIKEEYKIKNKVKKINKFNNIFKLINIILIIFVCYLIYNIIK